jgi:predicted HAD superfamily phosphohydrolase YqeG
LIAIVGDRILSDVVLGNHLGMFTIYVDPLHVDRENKVVRFVRGFENKILPKLSPKEPPKHPFVKSDEDIVDLVKRQ